MPTNLYDMVQLGSPLINSGMAGNDVFGSSVALSGDGSILVAGVPGRSTTRGNVYTYDWDSNTLQWTQRGSALLSLDGVSADLFGISIALSQAGDLMAVGATQWEGVLANQGGVYFYDESGTTWGARGSVLTAPDAAANDSFGSSVALNAAGTMIVVGGKNISSSAGAIYTFDWDSGTSAWIQRGSRLLAADTTASDNYGKSVSLSADGLVMAVGANSGIYIYDWDSGTASWIQRGSKLAGTNAALMLSAGGNFLFVSNTGIYTYEWSGGAWVQRGSVLAGGADTLSTDSFGSALAVDENLNTLIVGAKNWEEGASILNVGSIYRFDAYFHTLSNAAGDPLVDVLGDPAIRTIVAHDRATYRKIGDGISDVDGLFEFAVCSASECYVVAFDDVDGLTYNALILDKVTPV